MMISNVISKNKVIVQDDFFDDLVNGLKSHVEESIEKQDAKKSRVSLGGKQLALFKNKVTPLITKQIEKNGLLEEFVKKVQNSYYTTRIREVQSAFADSVSKYKNVEEEADDELEEVESDNKNYSLLVYRGFKIINTYRKLKNVYKVIQEMKSYVEPKGDDSSFDFGKYDLKNKSERQSAYDELISYILFEADRYVPVFEPLIKKISEAIWLGCYKAFSEFNREMYWMIGEELAIQSAIEVVSFLTRKFLHGAGYILGDAVQAGRAALFMEKIKRISYVGVYFAEAYQGVKKSRVVRTIGAAAYKSGRAFRHTRGDQFLGHTIKTLDHVNRNRRAYWNAYKWSSVGIDIVDIVNVDEDDINEVNEWAKSSFAPLMAETYAQYWSLRNDYDTVIDISNVFESLNDELTHSFADSFQKKTLKSQKYESVVNVENLKFDFNALIKLENYFDKAWYEYKFDWKKFGLTPGEIWDIGNGYTFNQKDKIIQAKDSKTNTIVMTLDGAKPNLFLSTFETPNSSRGTSIVIDAKKGRNGVDAFFEKYGQLIELKIHYLVFLPYYNDGTFVMLDRLKKEKVQTKTILTYKNRSSNDKRKFKVEFIQQNLENSITISRISDEITYNFEIKNDKNEIIQSNDLREIITFRNTRITDELDFRKKVDQLLEQVDKQLQKPRDNNVRL